MSVVDTVVVNDVTSRRQSVITHVVIGFLWQTFFHLLGNLDLLSLFAIGLVGWCDGAG